jgi:SutA RNAP-binding domain
MAATPTTAAPASAPKKPKPMRAAAKKKQPAAAETSQSIEDQTKAFLAGGGEVEQINSGVSGQQSMAGPRHITLGNNKSQSS